jgi:hypothetical protein
MLKYSKIVFLSIISILVGFYSCLLIKKFTSLTINEDVGFEINPLEIFSIIINIFLAFYITNVLGKKNDSRKYEKELLINYFLEYKLDFSERIKELKIQDNLESINTNANFKILRSRIFSIIGLTKESNLIDSSDEILSAIPEKISEIWELFTDTPKKPNNKTSAAVREDIQRIRLEKISKIDIANIALEKLIFQLILKINNK